MKKLPAKALVLTVLLFAPLLHAQSSTTFTPEVAVAPPPIPSPSGGPLPAPPSLPKP
ncbi:hypothetical protein [Candidatus Nitrosoglobus terrae]|uniref:hypothetical protein n=1 Tax=Candidatus Nitrosoglobus terrae TaxID=1630141 RepID=UPI0015529007|nr:hypothetical protein [Candidatus Nitrosoglobus terrae]